MRFVASVLLAIFCFATESSARDKSDWANVEKLKLGSKIVVWLWNGEELRGELEAVNATGLRLLPLDLRGAMTGPRRQLDRGSVHKIARVHHANPPDAGKWMLTAAVAGAAIGATGGAIYDGTHHGESYHWFTAGLGGAGVGFFGSCVVLAGMGAREAGITIFRHTVVVYEDKDTSKIAPH